MKPGSNRRPRSRPNNNNNNKRQGGRNSYDSNGPDGKVRGTAQQVLEKYQALGRDAMSAGDRIAAEAYFQFAEHYYRLVNADNGQQQSRKEQRPGNENVADADVTEAQATEEIVSDKPVEKESVASEIVTVPIMPGPIAAPVSEDAVKADEPEQVELLASSGDDPVTTESADVEKPKPVRRRRPRAKVEAPKEVAAEPAQA